MYKIFRKETKFNAKTLSICYPAALLQDFDLGVEATQVAGTDNNEIAVIFGVQDSSNFYEFAYSGDGFIMLGRYVDGQWEFIQEWTQTGGIRQGVGTNQVQVVVQGGFLTAYINNLQILSSEVPDYAGGFIGFGCGPFEAPEVHCTFDNLVVYEVS